jgi:hypothetical protein
LIIFKKFIKNEFKYIPLRFKSALIEVLHFVAIWPGRGGGKSNSLRYSDFWPQELLAYAGNKNNA